jgi:hypothetical protein
MKKTLIGAAVGALGAVGAAGLMSAAPASAEECGAPPIGIINPGNIVCNIASNGSSFAMSVSPGYNLGVLVNGTEDAPELGLVNQPQTFVDSVQRFLSGPIAPDGPVPVAGTTPETP